MNLFLCDLNKNTNENLNELLNSYQDYFIFIKDKDNISLYLDVNNLKKHLMNGIEIKYKKFIFLFLENINDLKKNKSYKFDILFKTISFSKYININIDFKKFFDENDNKNLENILNLNKRCFENKNRISIKDKNIILLDKNFYVDLNYNRFYINNYENKKHIFKFNSILINNISNLKNQIITLKSIKAFDSYKELDDKISNYNSNYNSNFNINSINNKTLFNIENNCVLIISDKYNIDSWKKNINLIFDNLDMEKDVYVINTIAHMSNITNKNIKNLKFLIININLLNNLNKIYLNKYSTNDLLELIKNIIYENSYNINIEYSNFENLFLFHWKNIIIDEINKFIKIELNLFSHLTSKNLKYYLHNEPNINTDIYNYFIKYTISNIDINDNNLYYFINKELIFNNYSSVDNFDKIKFIETELNEEENLIADSYKNNLNINKELSLLFIKSSYDYFVNTNVNDIKNKICNKFLNNNSNNIIQLKNKNKYFDNVITEYNISNKNFCCICMDRIEKNNFCILGCGHYYCKICILMHKINNVENCLCPICRNKFDIIYNLNSESDNNSDNNIDNNSVNNIDNNSDVSNNSNKLKQIIDIINSNNDKKILLVSDYKEVIKFINQKLIKKYNIIVLKNNKNYIKSCNIYITELNNLLKHNVYDIDIIIFLDINNINYNIFSKIKIRYDDYFFNTKELKYFIFYVKGFLLDDTIIKKIK